MARSHYVYVVLRPAVSTPVAAFTVKHELMSWLDRREDDRDRLHVWRMVDNPREFPSHPEFDSKPPTLMDVQ